MTDIQIDKDSRLSSEYMTSDEADAARKIDEFEDEPSWKTAIKKTLEAEDEETPQLVCFFVELLYNFIISGLCANYLIVNYFSVC